MAIESFPPIEEATEEGIVGVGGDLEIESLILAYSQGIFPWPLDEDYPLTWFSPDPRGVLRFEDLHISKSMKKLIKQSKFKIKINSCFEDVIAMCSRAQNRHLQEGAWINNSIIDAYIDLYNNGFAYSFEIFFDDELVGGVYGVSIGRIISGESMFYTKSNASKIALIGLMHYLNDHGVRILDTQMVSPIVETLGGVNISREEFLKIVRESTQNINDAIFPPPNSAEKYSITL